MRIVDARGLDCPMPLVMTKVAAEELGSDEGLTVLATDPEASVDLAAWAADEGYELTERAREGFAEFVLRSSAAE